ncbi:MAG: hypothetical protein ABL914_02595 [Novosphingobium sp.]|uniref:hypothetical protein n=1 Tax=Novosphingobium sp. TaxID=1874826 RepID=UPI0032BF0F47
MKGWLGLALLVAQAAVMILMMVMFWSQPRSGESYAQLAAMIIGFPLTLVSGLILWSVYGLRGAFPDRYRDKLLLGSTAMLIGTMIAVATGFFELGPR